MTPGVWVSGVCSGPFMVGSRSAEEAASQPTPFPALLMLKGCWRDWGGVGGWMLCQPHVARILLRVSLPLALQCESSRAVARHYARLDTLAPDDRSPQQRARETEAVCRPHEPHSTDLSHVHVIVGPVVPHLPHPIELGGGAASGFRQLLHKIACVHLDGDEGTQIDSDTLRHLT